MAAYAIGDIQGCYKPFRRLLDRIEFDPANDQLFITGDLVNRGKDSLKVLRYLMKHESSVRTVLGNHDLHLLAVSEGLAVRRQSDTFEDVLIARDRNDLLDWLRHQPIALHDESLGILMVHAAVHPAWKLGECMRHANEIETRLQGDNYRKFLSRLYGNKPKRWSEQLRGTKRLRCLVNIFTRLRFMNVDGSLSFNHAGAPGSQPVCLVPWFDFPTRTKLSSTIVFGHWSLLGVHSGNGVLALDAGCCWGRSLCAARIDAPEFEFNFERCG